MSHINTRRDQVPTAFMAPTHCEVNKIRVHKWYLEYQAIYKCMILSLEPEVTHAQHTSHLISSCVYVTHRIPIKFQ